MLQGQYRPRRRLGQALYGEVWLCENSHASNELVAIKEVALRHAKRALMENKCMDNPFDERRIALYLMQRQGHEHILQFQREFLDRGCWYMVMEYCEGGDLFSVLDRSPNNRMEEVEAMRYFRQVVGGVQFLHDSGVAHRDLSLENVLLKNGVCKICDFGLATEANRVCCGERVGKAYYMAPEIVEGAHYDPMAADMWSLGIMLFIMLTGSPLVPLASRSDKAFLALETFGVVKILEVWGVASSLSASVLDLLEGLVQTNPAKRLGIRDVAAHPALGEP
ncbi:hypothetical protein ATCC90586_006120 [Pythium insidiosum]|nr:hypothetical protein ATCC90586_006120 [Pythium insidiosum]